METEIHLPAALPVMTLPDTVFFPHALLPLHLFEPRYRQMLRDILAADRIFAVAHLDGARALVAGQFEPAHRIATAGIIRACQDEADGTSNLLLQGLCRVEFTKVLREEPYRVMEYQLLGSTPGAADEQNRRLRRHLLRLLALRRQWGAPTAGRMAAFLRTVEDPATFVDLAAFGLCDDAGVKQALLETLNVHLRLKRFARRIRQEIEALKLHRKLQGSLDDDAIAHN